MPNVEEISEEHHVLGTLSLWRETLWGKFYRFDGADSPIMPLWQRFRDIVEETGYWPLVLEFQEPTSGLFGHGIESLEEQLQDEVAPEAAFAAMEKQDLSSVIDLPTANELQRMIEQQRADLLANSIDIEEDLFYIDNPWVYVQDFSERSALEQFIGSSILLVPVTESWQVFLALSYGGVNIGPSPSEHAALFRHWEDLYGVELISLSGFGITARMLHPPQDHLSAIHLAWQHFRYCCDLGEEPLTYYAAKLFNNFPWRFEWRL